VSRCRIVVEYFEQCVIEGEIQRLTKEEAQAKVCAELNELITGVKVGRSNESEITLYDSVGIGLEDYSALRFTYELANRHSVGQELNFTPVISNPKNLFSMLR